jgi:hypothetical protein
MHNTTQETLSFFNLPRRTSVLKQRSSRGGGGNAAGGGVAPGHRAAWPTRGRPCARACVRDSAAAPTTSAGARGLFAARGLGAEPPLSGVRWWGGFTALMSTRRARRHVQRPGGHVSSRPASVSGTLSSARTAPSATTNSSKSICEVSASAVPAPPASRFAPRKARIAFKGGWGAGLSAGGRQEGSWRLRLLLSAFGRQLRLSFGRQSDTQEERRERGGDERRPDSAGRCRGAGAGAGACWCESWATPGRCPAGGQTWRAAVRGYARRAPAARGPPLSGGAGGRRGERGGFEGRGGSGSGRARAPAGPRASRRTPQSPFPVPHRPTAPRRRPPPRPPRPRHRRRRPRCVQTARSVAPWASARRRRQAASARRRSSRLPRSSSLPRCRHSPRA